ncbi:MAG: S8 family serine peptidase [Labilithrix sp.]|nr:S8 family serine peptidase [Labilithrix sp.]MCW5834666.1 S8 family serine peptidase [Labilithrix sp.]
MQKVERATSSRRGQRRRNSKGWIVALLAGALAACGSESTPRQGTLALPVDTSLAPAQSTIGSRAVARVTGESGVAMDFFLGELVVATDDTAKLDAFVARWGGKVVTSTEGAGDAPRLHHVTLDPSAADVEKLVAELNAKAPELRGTFRSSSDDAAKLLAVALAEANEGGMTVSPNYVVAPDGIADGTTSEAPTGDDPLYSTNAFDWPYMNQGSPQDIGVGAAWQIMERAGVTRNKVRIMVLDGGFANMGDMPVSRSVIGSWNEPNPGKCGGRDCPWHGSMVVSAAMGRLDDGRGAAGPAAPVGELLAVPFQSDFIGLLTTLDRIVTATTFGNPKIINISSSLELDLGVDIAFQAACLFTCPSISATVSSITAAVAATNKLIFASAGNQGKDVDNAGDLIEGSTTMPCESAGVVCVGGLAHNSRRLDPGSNFGSKTGDSTVDIYGPFSTWVGSDLEFPDNHARLRRGTSFSSPFVAGVAALVWASQPSLSARQVWEIVRDTAHVGGVHDNGGNQLRVNAHAAVARVLGGAAPSVTLTAGGATAPLNREWTVTAAVRDDGAPCPSPACAVTFDPAPSRVSGNTAFYTFTTVGPRTITVTARDPVGQPASATTTVNVVNSPPDVVITAPAAGASVAQGVALQFLGAATDVNEGAGPGPGSLPCVWSSSDPADVLPTNTCNFSYAFPSQGTRTITLFASDSQSLASSTTVSVTVTAPPVNYPPTIGATTRTPTQVTYNGDGFPWQTAFSLSTSASDPEGNTPITYLWKATSFRPKTTTVYASNVTIGSSDSVTWTPSSTPSLFGAFADLGNDCYQGQTVRVVVEATDSLGNTSTRTLPDFKVYRCTLD